MKGIKPFPWIECSYLWLALTPLSLIHCGIEITNDLRTSLVSVQQISHGEHKKAFAYFWHVWRVHSLEVGRLCKGNPSPVTLMSRCTKFTHLFLERVPNSQVSFSTTLALAPKREAKRRHPARRSERLCACRPDGLPATLSSLCNSPVVIELVELALPDLFQLKCKWGQSERMLWQLRNVFM